MFLEVLEGDGPSSYGAGVKMLPEGDPGKVILHTGSTFA